MSDRNKVLWQEGLLLEPQHFQQHERYLEAYVEGRAAPLRPYPWGFLSVKLDSEKLASGKIGLLEARGIFPDGTPFSMPDHDPLPGLLEIDPALRDTTVHLALPLRRPGGVDSTREPGGTLARFGPRTHSARDAARESGPTANLEVGALHTQLVPTSAALADFACIPLLRVVDRKPDGVEIDKEFIPTVLDVLAAPQLVSLLSTVGGMLNQLGEALAATATPVVRAGATDVSEFIKLQVVNRASVLLEHLSRTRPLHPETLYCALITLIGDLAAVATPSKRPPPLQEYRHTELRGSFDSLLVLLRSWLAKGPSPVVSIPVKRLAMNWYQAAFDEPGLLQSARLILAVRADTPSEKIWDLFPRAATLASPTSMEAERKLLSGIRLSPLKTTPPLIPYYENWAYFEIDRGERPDLWTALRAEQVIQVFVVEQNLPNLKLALWALRG